MPKAAAKRKCTFNNALQKDFPFLKKVNFMDDRVRCLHCFSEFSVSHGGRTDIRDHMKTAKHQASLIAAAQGPSLNSFFKNNVPENDDLLLAAKEATFAYHTAVHNISFKTADCSSKLISKFFEPKFSSARTKNEAIILNAIVPWAEEELKKELMKTHFVTVTVDTSNRKDIKLIPVIVRFFLPEGGVKVKLLDFQSVPGETAEIITKCLLSTIRKHNLSEKIVAYCGDNCNTNFGGVKRKGENNVFCHLKNALGRNIVGVGCGAHIVHNCIRTAVDVLPIEVEDLVVKIYQYFHIYTVRVTQLKEFCEIADIEYRKVLQHGNTRFLSLLPAIERILQIYEGLKSYFGSQEHCPLLIQRFFDSKRGEMYLWFVHGQLGLFNQVILAMEKTKATASDIVIEINKLKNTLKERREHDFIPHGAEKVLKVLVKEGECQEDEIKKEFSAFYDCCLSYIELWENSFGGGEHFVWVANTALIWADIKATAERINEAVGNAVINFDDLFNEFAIAKNFWSSRYAEWKEKATECEEKWVQLFSHLKDRNILVPNLSKVVEYIFCLPGTSAPVERTFSMMNSIWSQERGLMKESTVKSLLICKFNICLSCSQFNDRIKTNQRFLKKVHSTAKYKWSQPQPGSSLE